MKFKHLCNVHKMWNDILVIGKTIERDNKKYHIVGMTLADEAELYIIEPYNESEDHGNRKRGVHNQRRILKENIGSQVNQYSYLDCRYEETPPIHIPNAHYRKTRLQFYAAYC